MITAGDYLIFMMTFMVATMMIFLWIILLFLIMLLLRNETTMFYEATA